MVRGSDLRLTFISKIPGANIVLIVNERSPFAKPLLLFCLLEMGNMRNKSQGRNYITKNAISEIRTAIYVKKTQRKVIRTQGRD